MRYLCSTLVVIPQRCFYMNRETFFLAYTESCQSRQVYPLTSERFKELISSERVCDIMHAIKKEEDDDKKSELKSKLPAVIYGCLCPTDGKRPTNATAMPSGYCMHDWDHMTQNPRVFYIMHIAKHEQEMGIALVHITPRGKGLRLVTRLQEGESIADCQHRIASHFGMSEYVDPAVKDVARISFLPCKDYMLYVDESLFEGITLASSAEKTEAAAEAIAAPAETPAVAAKAPAAEAAATPAEVPAEAPIPAAEVFDYQGIKYSVIIKALMERIATQGKTREGERNTDLYQVARELRHICDYNFQKVYSLLAPYFSTLTDKEIRLTIGNAIGSAGRTITPVLRGVLDELKHELADVDTERTDPTQPKKLPKLSPIEEMMLAKFPSFLRPNLYLASLPVWGTIGTHVRFDYMDGRECSLSFMTAVVAKSAGGKGSMAHLYELMTKKLREEDAVERQKADAYYRACNRASENSEKPEEPRVRIRLFSDDITTSQIFEYLDNLKGQHALQFTEEIDTLNKAKRSIYGNNDDIYRKAFDNGMAGKESKSKLTRNIRIPIYLNTLFCGTGRAMHKFYNNPESGLNNRIIFTYLPNVRVKGWPKYERFTEEEQALFDETAERLSQMGKDGKMSFPMLDKIIERLKNRMDREDDENPDEVWYDLGKRALAIAYRAGVLQYLLRGCPDDKKQLTEIGKVMTWVFETVRMGVYTFSGESYEENYEENEAINKRHRNMQNCKNKQLFSLLPEMFTAKDVMELKAKNGEPTKNPTMVVSRWVEEGMVVKVTYGKYKKAQ